MDFISISTLLLFHRETCACVHVHTERKVPFGKLSFRYINFVKLILLHALILSPLLELVSPPRIFRFEIEIRSINIK